MNKEDETNNKRCCLCWPLRCNLLTWAYFKLVSSAVFITVISYALLHTLVMYKLYGKKQSQIRVDAEIAITIIALSLFVADFLVTVIFVVGRHRNMKQMRRLKPFYYCSIVTWILAMLLTAMAVSLSIESLFAKYMTFPSSVVNIINFVSYFVTIVVQTYYLLLLRNEIIKLIKNNEVRFLNNGADASCTVRHDTGNKEASDGDTDIEEV
nr:uncharacterized protein LOC110372195 [Helicoverpa armigera]